MVATENIYKISEENKKLVDRYINERESNAKSPYTLKNERATLKHLSDFVKNKSLKDVTEDDLKSFIKSRDLKGLRLTQFYRWLEKLEKKQKPERMKWFEFSTSDQKEKAKDPDVKKYLITDDEYKKIIDICEDGIGM